MNFKNRLHEYLRPRDTVSFVTELADRFGVKVVLDVGCGTRSPLRALRSKLFLIGVDGCEEVLAQARQNSTHDLLLLADITADDLSARVHALGYESVDLVVLLDVIEHLDRESALRLLKVCESLATKYVLVRTPNGFLPQGPEYGNPAQRHLSGWFPHDFEGLGYRVYGVEGMRWMLGYAASMKVRFPGLGTMHLVLSKLLRISSRYRLASSVIAIKSIVGHPAVIGKVANVNRLPLSLRYLP